jgi:hypothetical protein
MPEEMLAMLRVLARGAEGSSLGELLPSSARR